MDLYELPFAKIIILSDDIAEVMINDGIDMDIKMVNKYHDFLLSHLNNPFSLLINKVNSYAYTGDAQNKLATLKEINAMAIVSYNRVTTSVTEGLALMHEEDWHLKIFNDRSVALKWLESEQYKVKQT